MFNTEVGIQELETLGCGISCSKIQNLMEVHKVKTIEELQQVEGIQLETTCIHIIGHNFSVGGYSRCAEPICTHEISLPLPPTYMH